jgi:ABC-type nitrate/sulfonate/bicarbonate transport system substrate-binding protein
MRSLRFSLAALTAAALTLASLSARAADPVKIRFGWAVVPASMVPLFPEKKDILKHYGKSYVLEPIHFRGTPQMITAQASGDIDISTLAYSSFALAIENAKLDDLRVIADEFQDGVPGYYTNSFVVRKDSPIKTIKDLKGKVLGSNAGGSAVDIAIRAILRKNGIDDKRDVSFVEAPLPTTLPVLRDKKADLMPAVLPFAANPKLWEVGRTLFTQKEAVGETQMIIWASRLPFLTKNHQAMVDFMDDAIHAMEWFRDPKNHDATVELVSKFTKIPKPVFDSWLFVKGKDYYRDPKLIPNLKSLQANVDLQVQLGFLKKPLDVNKYSDLSYVKEAGKRGGM